MGRRTLSQVCVAWREKKGDEEQEALDKKGNHGKRRRRRRRKGVYVCIVFLSFSFFFVCVCVNVCARGSHWKEFQQNENTLEKYMHVFFLYGREKNCNPTNLSLPPSLPYFSPPPSPPPMHLHHLSLCHTFQFSPHSLSPTLCFSPLIPSHFLRLPHPLPSHPSISLSSPHPPSARHIISAFLRKSLNRLRYFFEFRGRIIRSIEIWRIARNVGFVMRCSVWF